MGRHLKSALVKFRGNQKSRKTHVSPGIGPLRSHHKLLQNSVDNGGGWLKFKQRQLTKAEHTSIAGVSKKTNLRSPRKCVMLVYLPRRLEKNGDTYGWNRNKKRDSSDNHRGCGKKGIMTAHPTKPSRQEIRR